jgi:hypothetical protein
MGNSSRSGSVVIDEVDEEPFEIDGERYLVRKSRWNQAGETYDLVRVADEMILTMDDSFESNPTDQQIADVLTQHDIDAEVVECKLCERAALAATAHRHENGWVGDRCCWDERLRSTE